MKINNELVELYKSNKKDEVIKYCNNCYEEIYDRYEALSNDHYLRECAKHLCNFIILETLNNNKIKTSNVIEISKKALVDYLIDEKELNKDNIGNLEKAELEKAFNSINQNHELEMEIVNEGIMLLWHLYKIDRNSMGHGSVSKELLNKIFKNDNLIINDPKGEIN
ncbi:MAG: hypothetical protein ACLRSC_08370 [Clostridium perfringens]